MHDERKVEYLVVKCEYRFGDFFTKEVVKRLKSADVEEVVRCKDCKHWLKMDGSCFPHADYNDFCSNGERRNDETD